MAENSYAYAVARIRSKELTLISQQNIEQLLGSDSYAACLSLLAGKGWSSEAPSPEALLAKERQKTWALITELVEDLSVFNVFRYLNDYHNLKAGIKQISAEAVTPNIFMANGTIPAELIVKAVKENNFSLLPIPMQKVGQEAYETMLHTNDGQLCDVMIDKAGLEAIVQAGKDSKNPLIQKYAELMAATANIKTAVRCQKMRKKIDFIKRTLAHCDTLDTQRLGAAAAIDLEEICEYLAATAYAEAVAAIRESHSALERWCDNQIIRVIRPQRFNPFTIGPLVAYLLARENEIKAVRIILSGKINGLSEESMRERLRETYV